MDISLLKTFLELNRTRHFGQAAENLFLTQSAISARIRLLEQNVGVPLFTRTRNNIELTSAGEKLLKHADTIINTWTRARQEIALEENDGMSLAVGGVPSLWDIHLQTWLNNLFKDNANLSLHAEVHGPELLVRKLIDRSLDLAFMFESLQMTELMVEEVGVIDLILVCSEADKAAQEAVNSKYILVNWGTSFSITHAQFFPDITPPRLHVQIGRMALANLLECGGAAYIAKSMVRDALAKKKLFQVMDAPVIKRTYYAAYSPNSDKRDTIETVLKSLHSLQSLTK